MDDDSRSMNSIDRAVDINLFLKQETREMGVTADSFTAVGCSDAAVQVAGSAQRS